MDERIYLYFYFLSTHFFSCSEKSLSKSIKGSWRSLIGWGIELSKRIFDKGIESRQGNLLSGYRYNRFRWQKTESGTNPNTKFSNNQEEKGQGSSKLPLEWTKPNSFKFILGVVDSWREWIH